MTKYLLFSLTLIFVAGNAFAAFNSEIERPAPDITLYATPASITAGGKSTLTWTTRFATSCTASGGWSGGKARFDSKPVSPSVTTTYTLTCHGRGGSTTASVEVVVVPVTPQPPQPPQPPVTPTTTPPTPTPAQCADGIDNDADGKTDYPSDPGCTSATDTDETNAVTPSPTCTLTASTSTVLVNQPFTVTWTTTNADYIGDVGGKNNPSGTTAAITVPTPGPYVYAITAYGAGGTAQCSVTVTVVSVPTQPPPAPTCPVHTTPSCSSGSYVTTGPSDANGCTGAPRCTAATVFGAPVYIAPMKDTSGATHSAAAGSSFGVSGIVGANAVYIPAPVVSTSQTKYDYGQLGIDARKVWWLSGSIGLSPVIPTTTTPPPSGGGGGKGGGSIQGATFGGSVKLVITATADKIDPSDPASEILYTTTVTPASAVQQMKVPLGVWGMRPNLKISLSAQKAVNDTLQYGVILDGLNMYSYGDRPDQGIVNNDPEWKSVDQQNKQLAVLATFPVSWIHDSIRTTGASWGQAPLLKRVQDQGKKIQLVIGPLEEDYDLGSGAKVPGTNEWGGALPFSKINFALYEKRLRNNLTSYKNAGVDVKAVEVGNELDLVAFNADISMSRAPTAADYQLFAETYAKFLEKTASIVKRPEFYPNAKIILGSPAIDWSPATGKLDPSKMYAPLKSMNGKNYFNLVDGIGVHYYPADHEDGSQSVLRTQNFLSAIGETQRPLWVSEWGFYNNRFPNSAGKDRYRAFVDLYDKIIRADYKVVFMTNFALDEFSFPFHLVNSSYVKLPEARFFDHYPSPVPSIVALQKNNAENAVACVGCTASDWLDELMATFRDFLLRNFGS